jgi:L-lactate dehydrogenase (cytochrome)
MYQLYLMGGRPAAEAAIERARVAGFAALVVTIDTAVAGIRERDHRNGMKELVGPGLLAKVPFLPEILSHPGWLVGFLRDGGIRPLPNVVIPGLGPMPLLDVAAALASSTVTWADLTWIRAAWRGPIVVKGVLTAEDARRAVDEARSRSPSEPRRPPTGRVQASVRVAGGVAAVKGRRSDDGGIRRADSSALCPAQVVALAAGLTRPGRHGSRVHTSRHCRVHNIHAPIWIAR